MELKHVPFSRAPLKLQLASNLFRPLLFRLKRALLEVDERKVEVREKLWHSFSCAYTVWILCEYCVYWISDTCHTLTVGSGLFRLVQYCFQWHRYPACTFHGHPEGFSENWNVIQPLGSTNHLPWKQGNVRLRGRKWEGETKAPLNEGQQVFTVRLWQYDCDSTTVSHLNELFKPPNPHFTFGSKAEQRHVLEPFSSSRPVSKWNALIKSKQLQCTDLTLVLTRAQTSHWVDGLSVRTGSGNERLFLCGNMLPSVVEFNRPSDYCCLLHWQINPVNNNNNSLSLLILQIPVSRSSTSSTRSLSFPGTNSVFFFKLNQRCWTSIKHSLSCLHDLISHVPDSYTQAIMLRC